MSARRQSDTDLKDTADKMIVFSHRTLWAVLWTVIAIAFAASAGYFDLRATASDALSLGKKHESVITPLACDVRQLKNFMIYGIKPKPNDACY
jgi:hypothetical protein